jgi:glycosyltransferase involved in cell wall biosynthesis
MMLKKRILFINNSSSLGIGTSASLLLLLKYLHNEFDCAVVSDEHSFQLPQALEKIAIRHFALPDHFILFLPALVSVILRGKYDLVYANGSNERSRTAFWAAKITRRPLIWHIRESLRRKKYAGTIRFADCVIANSDDTAERLKKYANVTKQIVIANGVELENQENSMEGERTRIAIRFGLHHDWLRIINVGRICPDKNQADVLCLARDVVIRFPKTYFFIVGPQEEDYLVYLKELVAQFDIRQHVIFTGYIPNTIEIIHACDIMLHVSKKESQGRVLLEAMAARLPVVAYDVGGVAEVVLDGKTGFLQPFGNLDGMVESVCRLIVNPAERIHMGESGYQHVKENYPAEKTAQSVREIICQVLEKKVAIRNYR